MLEGTDTCFAPVLNFAEAPRHPHNIARGTFLDIDGVVQPAPATRFSRSAPSVVKPPGVGEHTEEILRTLGLDSDAIVNMREAGIF